jgi:zinc/manganese transport system substrate-binding protein
MQRRRFLQGARSAFVLSLPLALHRGAIAATDAAPLKVVASFSILADMVREVGGAAVEVVSLVPAGGDAHVFTPTPADARRVGSAGLLVINGLRYEGWIERLVKAAGYKGTVVTASRGVRARPTAGGADPHAWQNLAHALVYVENIRAALGAARPTHAAAIDARAADYSARLRALDADIRQRLASVPAERRRVITDHDAFGYFGDAYGVRFMSPRGWSTDSEPSADTVARIVRQVREQQASALLVEQLSDPRLIERIAREAGVRVGGRLYADALSAPGGEADTYLRLFAYNVATLVAAMGGPGARP